MQYPASQLCQGVFTLNDAPSFSELTSKTPPLGSMLNFDADVKKHDRASPNVKTASVSSGPRGLAPTCHSRSFSPLIGAGGTALPGDAGGPGAL